MAEHRDPGTGGEPDQPERDPQQHDDSEPEFGSSEWLLAQLTGGRRVERADETVGATTGVAPEGEREEDGAGVGGADGGEVAPETSESTVSSGDEPASGAFDDLLREPTASGEDVGAPAAQPVPLDFADLLRDVPAPTPDESADDDVATTPIATAPQGFVWNLTSRQDGERDDTVASAPSAEPDRTSAFGAERPTEEASAPEADAEDATPPVRRTNFVEPQSRPARETPAAESAAASGPAAGSAPAAQPEVPAAQTPPAQTPPAQTPPAQTPPAQTPAAPAQGFEPPSFVAALRMPRPPEWGDAPSSPAEPPAGSDSVAPAGEGLGESRPNVDEPEAEPKPPTNDTEPLHGHGLAALLGAYQDERPAPRPLLGDTTGIIPLPPTYIPPAPTAPPTQTPPPTTPAVATPETVTPETVSPGAGTSGSDANPAPVTRREALRAEGETAPGAFVPPALSEPAPPAPVVPPDEGPFDEAAQTEAILGAPPSPATSPFDAAALAAASAELSTAAIPVGDVPAAPEPAQPVGRAAGELNDAGEADVSGADGPDEPDGIAALFGDFALAEGTDDDSDRVHEVGSPVVDESQPAAESAPAAAADADTPAPADPAATAQGGSLGIDAILFPELAGDAQASREADPDAADASLPEPAAALEGPQLGAEPGAGFGLDDFDTAAPPTVAFDAAAAAREPLAAPTPPSPATTPVDSPAAGPAAGPAATAAWAAAGPSASTAPATRPTSPSSTPPSSTPPPSTPPTPSDPPRGPRDPRLNRRIYLIAGVLAVLLVLVGLFALGTRIPALFGASAPSHPASASRAASATPTPTPTPTVIQKPAAAVGPGEHAWDTLGGGECIQPYTSPWAETFTVVDCTADHSAQMVYTNLLSADPAAPYPGADALAQQINTLCTAGGVVDLNAAAAYPDLQVQGTFPATDAQWKSGQRSYYCFASRSSGQPLSTSVQGQGPTG